jgi:hypothetical protein
MSVAPTIHNNTRECDCRLIVKHLRPPPAGIPRGGRHPDVQRDSRANEIAWHIGPVVQNHRLSGIKRLARTPRHWR